MSTPLSSLLWVALFLVVLKAQAAPHIVSITRTPMPLGALSVQVGVGTPPQYFNLALDTSREYVTVPSQYCSTCTQATRYIANHSLTFSKPDCVPGFGHTCHFSDENPCGALIDQECIFSGIPATDVLTLGDLRSAPAGVLELESFSSNYLLYKVLDGVLGMAGDFWKGGKSAMSAFESQLGGQFGYCLGPKGQGGLLMLGGVDPAYFIGDMKYTPMLSWYEGYGGDQYLVNVSDIRVGSKSLGLPPAYYNSKNQFSVLDSVVALTEISPPAFSAMQSVFTSLCNGINLHGICDVPPGQTLFQSGVCVPMTQAQLAIYPPLSFSLFSDVHLTITPEEYLIEITPGSGQYCLGFVPSERETRLGSLIFSRYTLHFDRHNKRVGFAPTNPETCKSHGSSKK